MDTHILREVLMAYQALNLPADDLTDAADVTTQLCAQVRNLACNHLTLDTSAPPFETVLVSLREMS